MKPSRKAASKRARAHTKRRAAVIAVTLIAVAGVLAIALFSYSGINMTTAQPPATPSVVYVIIQKDAGMNLTLGFDPAKITIMIGVNNTVFWKNEDSDWHTAHSNIPEFNSGLIPPGGNFTHTFLRAGVYPYHCDPHPWMTGVVTVEAGVSTSMNIRWSLLETSSPLIGSALPFPRPAPPSVS